MAQQILKVDEINNDLRLDVFLTQNLPEAPSRTFLKGLIDTGQVTVNDKKVKPHHKVFTGDSVSIDLPEQEEPIEGVAPENIPLDIFYEDDCLLIINKPAGLLVHPVNNLRTGTLVNALLYHCNKLSVGGNPLRPGIVHRLDRETSGLLVVAKDGRTHSRLSRQFEQHLVRKRYVALVKGNIEFEEGMVDAPISRHPRFWDKKAVSYADDARDAVTTFHVLKRFNGQATLVALYPQSGRTHQLRVHMKHLGHPIIGDEKYGDKDLPQRMRLHAQALAFTHPQTKKYLEFSCALPQDFMQGYLS